MTNSVILSVTKFVQINVPVGHFGIEPIKLRWAMSFVKLGA